MRFPIDYLAIGPVYTTKTKENADAAVGLETVEKVRRIIESFPLVAIGGINSTNFRAVLAAGADSIAVIGDLLGDADKISEKTRKFIDLAASA